MTFKSITLSLGCFAFIILKWKLKPSVLLHKLIILLQETSALEKGPALVTCWQEMRPESRSPSVSYNSPPPTRWWITSLWGILARFSAWLQMTCSRSVYSGGDRIKQERSSGGINSSPGGAFSHSERQDWPVSTDLLTCSLPSGSLSLGIFNRLS